MAYKVTNNRGWILGLSIGHNATIGSAMNLLGWINVT